MFRYLVRFGYVAWLVNRSAVFIKAIFESSFRFTYILFVTAFALSHVSKGFTVAGNGQVIDLVSPVEWKV